MPRLIRFSNSPYQARALDALFEPLICCINIVVGGWLYPAWRTARVQWEPDVAELIRLFNEQSRPIICYAWHKYELIGICAFRDFPQDSTPIAISHDGFWSRSLQQIGVWYDLPVWVYRRRSPIKPKDQLINLLKRERPIIGLFPDSGGPDSHIRSGFVDVAQATGALLIPMVWHSRPVLIFRSPRRYYFPIPFSRVIAYYGRPIEGTCVTSNDCRNALEELEERIHDHDN
jgi:lysophospholipid acyltransferase (LPLAT)-like uncharacterized protein